MPIDVATSIARVLKHEGVVWVSTFPVCRWNNALGRGAAHDDFVRGACIIALNWRADPEYRAGSGIMKGGTEK